MVEADIFSEDSLKPHFSGQDVVMSCLGFPPSFFSPVTGYSRSMNSVVGAMREARVNRIITMTSWYTERECRRDDAARGFFRDLIMKSSPTSFVQLYFDLPPHVFPF